MSRQFAKIRSGINFLGLSADPSDPANGDFYYNTTSNLFRQYIGGSWANVISTASAVTSVFTRTGGVVATNGDYTVSQITGAAPLASPTFTGTLAAASGTFSGTLGVTGITSISSGSSDGNIKHGGTAGRLILDGDSGSNGAGLALYGSTQGTAPSRFQTYADNYRFENLSGTARLTISSTGAVAIPGSLAVTGVTTHTGNVVIGGSSQGTNLDIELPNASVSVIDTTAGSAGNSSIFQRSIAGAYLNYVTYGASATGGFIPGIAHAGLTAIYSGGSPANMVIGTLDAVPLTFMTNSLSRLTISSAGLTTASSAITGTFNTVLAATNTSTTVDSSSALNLTKYNSTTTSGANPFIFFFTGSGGSNANGYIGTASSTSVGFFAASDKRLKKDIRPIDGALDKIIKLNPVNYRWKKNNESATGFIAQEFAEVLPQFVYKSDEGKGEELAEGAKSWTITEQGMVPFLVKAIQELHAEITKIKTRRLK